MMASPATCEPLRWPTQNPPNRCRMTNNARVPLTELPELIDYRYRHLLGTTTSSEPRRGSNVSASRTSSDRKPSRISARHKFP